MENKMYLHSRAQGTLSVAGLGVKGPQAALGPHVQQSTEEGSGLSLPLGPS